MCRRCGERTGRRRLFPEQTPPGLNYAVVTGTLLDDPREGGGPGGTPVLVMEIEFPVADPEHPRLLWTYASYEVEVPGDVGGRHVEELKKGAPVLVAGRLSERCSLEDGRASCRGAIIANLIHPGPPPEQPGGSLGARYMPCTRRALDRSAPGRPPRDESPLRPEPGPLPRGRRCLPGRAELPRLDPSHRGQPAGARRAHAPRRHGAADRRQPRRPA